MKFAKPLLVLAAVLLSLGFGSHKAYAHFPETQGSLTAVLHVEPDDYPAAGQTETVYFIFDDTTQPFQVANCLCNLSIHHSGQLLYTTALAPADGSNSIYDTKGIPFVFSRQGTYQINLTGQPTGSATFKPFDLNWNFQVGPPLEPSAPGSNLTILKYFAAILAIMAVIGLAVFILA